MIAIEKFRFSIQAALLALGLASFSILGQAADQPAQGAAPKAETPASEAAAPATGDGAAKSAAPASTEAAPAKAKAPASAHKATKRKQHKKPLRAKKRQPAAITNCGLCTTNGIQVTCNKLTGKYTCSLNAARCDTQCI